ncbi:MAG TPA: enoyl-CoA hydratase-related protein [Dehalococcoidia bacterium]|nr:enoyl-CoA hydratase-related protein [Dehalococcoidia bacterium]
MTALLYEKRDGIAYITLNRPHVHNAIDPEMMVRLAEAWRDFEADDSLRVAIVTGAGDRAFSAGADLGRLIPLFTGARQPEDEWDHRLMAERDLVNVALMRRRPIYKPIVAAINGFCLAGGTEMALATDIRIAAEHATLGLSEVQRALVPGGGSMVRLPRQVPYCKAMEILLVGDPIPAQEAYRFGLVNYVVPQSELMATAERFARRIAENGPLAVRKIKEAVLRTSGVPLEEAFRIEDEISREVFASEDAKEGPRAFMEKRPPQYKGR